MMPVDKNPSIHSWRHHSTMIHPTTSSSSNSPIQFGAVSYYSSSQHENGDRRTAHNAIERQRRECLNSKFEQLAHALPGLQNVRRPSKSMIVSKSLEFVTKSVHRDSSYQNKIRQLRKEHDTLRKHTERSQQQLRKRIHSEEEEGSISSSPPPPLDIKKKQKKKPDPSPKHNKIHPKKPAVLHKFVHHHASSSNETKPTSFKPPSPAAPSNYRKPFSSSSTSATTTPPCHFSFIPPPLPPPPPTSQSWPLLDLSAMQHPDTLVPTPSFYSPDMLNVLMQPRPFTSDPTTSHPDPSSYFWK